MFRKSTIVLRLFANKHNTQSSSHHITIARYEAHFNSSSFFFLYFFLVLSWLTINKAIIHVLEQTTFLDELPTVNKHKYSRWSLGWVVNSKSHLQLSGIYTENATTWIYACCNQFREYAYMTQTCNKNVIRLWCIVICF